MKVYKLRDDNEHFKYFVYKDSTNSKRTMDFKGQRLADGWQPLEFITYVEPKKADRNKREDFDAGCSFSEMLLIRNALVPVFKTLLGDKIECLPVITDDKADEFSYVNVLNVLTAIPFETMTTQEFMQSFRANAVKFTLEKVKDELLFRNEKGVNYFCTDAFIAFIEREGIKGLRFLQIGTAE